MVGAAHWRLSNISQVPNWRTEEKMCRSQLVFVFEGLNPEQILSLVSPPPPLLPNGVLFPSPQPSLPLHLRVDPLT